MSLDLPPDCRSVFANVLCDLSHAHSLLKSCLDCQSVIKRKMFFAHVILQSEDRADMIVAQTVRKRNLEIATATSRLLSHVIVNATSDVAFNFSINLAVIMPVQAHAF